MAEKTEKTPKTVPAPTDTHKDRSVWYYQRSSFPLRDAMPTELEKAWAELDKSRVPEHHWEEAGPHNIAGRFTSLVVHPDAPNTLHAGAAGGGVWRSTDGGANWKPAWPLSASHNIGALAIHPNDVNGLIAATGEANLSADGYPGSGFYCSSDGGDTWIPFFQTPDGKPVSEEEQQQIPRRVGTIAFSPFEFIRSAMGSVSLDERMQAGLYLIDPNTGFAPCTFWGKRSYNCHSVVYHPKVNGLLFAAIETRGTLNGIWRSADNGVNWTQLTNGLPPTEQFRRTSLAIAPSQPDTMYALAADRARNVLGIFRSDDQGKSWRPIGNAAQFPDENFMSYNNTIVVHPRHPDFVIWGGVNLHRTTDGGKTWRQISFRFPNSPAHVHEDQHALVMPDGDLVYSANDGGIAKSVNGGDTWTSISQGLMTAMFYDIDVAPTNSQIFGGGAQDAGTLVAGVSTQGKEFLQAFPGDGGWLLFDPNDEQHVFGSAQNLTIRRHRKGEPWFPWTDVSPQSDDLTDEERTQRAIAVLAIEPGTVQGTRKVWAGSSRLWLTADDGETWAPASDFFDGSAISAIEVAGADPKVMYVGTSIGGIFRSADGGKTWSQELGSMDIPPRLITRIVTHPKDAKTVVVAVASTGMPGVTLASDSPAAGSFSPLVAHAQVAFQKTYSNIFQSADGGANWTDLDLGQLPNVVFNAVEYETRDPFRLFAAGDAGVYVKLPNRWMAIHGNLPAVVISDLVYHHSDQILLAATYGRGIWRFHTDKLKIPE